MSKSALSVFVFGLYLAVLGIILIVVPNILLGLFSFPSTNEVWIRVVGVLVIILAFFYIVTAHKDMIDFFRLTVIARPAVFAFFIAFVLLGLANPPLILFGVADVLGAIWTFFALRAQKR